MKWEQGSIWQCSTGPILHRAIRFEKPLKLCTSIDQERPELHFRSMKTNYRLVLSLLLLTGIFFLWVSPSWALFNRGGELGVGTRAMGLAGAFVAVADDPTASYWNPAGLAQLPQPEILGTYGSYFNDKDRNVYFSFEMPLKKDIHIGISTNNLFYTDIPGSHEDQY